MTQIPSRQADAEADDRVPLRLHLVALLLVLGLGLGAATFGALRHFITVDGLAYLDMAEVYLNQGWSAGTNGYWGPLYPLFLSAALALVRPSLERELFVVQGVHFGIFVLALCAFIFFWREIDRLRGRVAGGPRGAGLPPLLFWGIGYLLFLWCSLRLIKIWTMSPDMLVLAAVLVAGGLLLRMRDRPAGWLAPLAFGVTLGFGYLAKAAMFPLAFIFLVGAVGVLGLTRAGVGRVMVAALAFGVVAGPFVLTLSLQKERFTFGDSGKLNYARYVNGVPHIHWQGDEPGQGTPKHPTRRVARGPDVFEFESPVDGTYPPWYDPSYWYEGVEVQFDLRQQVSALTRTGRAYLDHIFLRQGAAIAAILLLLTLPRAGGGPSGHGGAGGGGPPERQARAGWLDLLRLWPLWIPVLAAIGMYSLVYVEMRYLAGFFVLGWGAALASISIGNTPANRRLLSVAGAVTALVFALNLGVPNEKALGSLLRVPQPPSAASWFDHGTSGAAANHLVADALRDMGIGEGATLGFIGYGYYSYWARLAGARVTAEVPSAQAPGFWEGDEEVRARTIEALFATGVDAVLAEVPPQHRAPDAWRQLGGTAYFALHRNDPRPGPTPAAIDGGDAR